MDNVTHSLIGVALGQAYSWRNKNKRFRKAAIWTAVLGSNLPDFDFFWNPGLGAGVGSNGLGYLLEHRGYTHSLLLALPIGLLASGLGARLGRVGRTFELRLLVLGVLASLLHVAADFCNNYGVHPFSPFFNRWFYGDTLFIVEPLIWVACLPLLYETVKSGFGKGLALAVGTLLFGLLWFGPFTTAWVAGFVTLFGVLIAWLQKGSTNPKYAFLSIGGIVLSFLFGSVSAQSIVREWLREKVPETTLRELVSTPAPSNPFCWSFVTASTEGALGNLDYVVRGGVASLLPSIFDPRKCHFVHQTQHSSGTENSVSIDSSELFRRPLSEFELLKSKSCRFSAFLNFARIPQWYYEEGVWFAGDLRYEGRMRKSFTRLQISPFDQECPKELPSWEPPTHRILGKTRPRASH